MTLTDIPAPSIGTVAVIGAGPAGLLFAQACLSANLRVILEDVLPARLRTAATNLAPFTDAARLDLVLTVEDAVREADLAVDFVPDELESKLEIFSMLDRMAPPRTILCTPTETLSIADLASCVYRPERCFALRGALTLDGWNIASATQLLVPRGIDPIVQRTMEHFFETLGLTLTAEPDDLPPMLVKNLPT